MLDFFGNPLAVGQTVAFMVPGYRELRLGTVIRITAQRVRVQYRYQGSDHEFTTPFNTVIIRDPE